MTLGSLFSGSGGFELAGVLNGITPIWSSEIEAFPLKVTAARFPKVKQLGDVTKIDGAAIEPVDIITFGSPCQDLSVAGKQAGIHEGQRSNLFFEAVRIIREMREHDENNGRTDKHIRPRFAVWENVPGAFSSNKGADFKAVLDAFCQVKDPAADVPQPKKWGGAGCVVGDGYSVAWRVYDAQYWPGTPQRRKRIYLIADFGSERAGEILFEREGVRGDSAESGAAREGAAEDAERGAGGSDCACGFVGLQGAKSGSIGFFRGGCPTLRAGITVDTVYPTVVRTLAARHDSSPCMDRGQNVVCYNGGGNGGWGVSPTITGDEGGANTLMARDYKDPQIVCYDARGNGKEREYLVMKKQRKYIVRRLTPLECCRLQGFPDWWDADVEGSDSARYKMWGNGIALPCAADVLRRIAKELQQ